MVVEHFEHQDVKAIYRRLRERGRAIPDGLTFRTD
jgi:tRNA splicing endonuclease